jgi:ribulose-phosphate 3-epimerase
VRHVLEDVDQVLVMSVNPGFGGQAFIPNVLPKIRELREELARRKLDVDIEIDGGIKVDNVHLAVEAGANVIVAGSAVFGSPDYEVTISALRKNAEAAR